MSKEGSYQVSTNISVSSTVTGNRQDFWSCNFTV